MVILIKISCLTINNNQYRHDHFEFLAPIGESQPQLIYISGVNEGIQAIICLDCGVMRTKVSNSRPLAGRDNINERRLKGKSEGRQDRLLFGSDREHYISGNQVHILEGG